jgi:hypothetical protein
MKTTRHPAWCNQAHNDDEKHSTGWTTIPICESDTGVGVLAYGGDTDEPMVLIRAGGENVEAVGMTAAQAFMLSTRLADLVATTTR